MIGTLVCLSGRYRSSVCLFSAVPPCAYAISRMTRTGPRSSTVAVSSARLVVPIRTAEGHFMIGSELRDRPSFTGPRKESEQSPTVN